MTYLLAAVLPVVPLLLASPAGVAGRIRMPSNRDYVSTSQVFSPQFMGMHMLSPTRQWQVVPLGVVRPAGTTWGFIEKDKDVFDWCSVDRWVAAAPWYPTGLCVNVGKPRPACGVAICRAQSCGWIKRPKENSAVEVGLMPVLLSIR